jgi:hypothetical protein
MLVVPIVATPSQTLQAVLGNQVCKINIYQKSTGLFVDLYVNDDLVIGGVIAENLNRIVRSAYLGFIGDLAFIDTQGDDDPIFSGLGSRWLLVYIEAVDLAAQGLAA